MAATKGKSAGAPPTAQWGYRWTPDHRNDESGGLVKTLWADLRGKQLPHAEASEDDAWYEEEQAQRAEFSAKVGRAHTVDAGRRENFRRRYWN